MGDPKRQRKKYSRPLKRWDSERIEEEAGLKEEYGLRRKHELWKAEAVARRLRRTARSVTASGDKEAESVLSRKVVSMGLLPKGEANVDSVLGLTVKNILERRLQTVVVKKELANTMMQARQFIVHGHVRVGERRVSFPSYLVRLGEDDRVQLDASSTLAKGLKHAGKKPGVKKDVEAPAAGQAAEAGG